MRTSAAVLAAFFMISCGANVSLPKEKAEFAWNEIVKIAREYEPLADQAFANESIELREQRIALRARLLSLIEFVMNDLESSDSHQAIKVFSKIALLISEVLN